MTKDIDRGPFRAKKSGAAVSAPDVTWNLEEGVSMIPLSITFNHARHGIGFQKIFGRNEKKAL